MLQNRAALFALGTADDFDVVGQQIAGGLMEKAERRVELFAPRRIGRCGW